MNADPRSIVCAELSKSVFQAVGRLMFDHSWVPQAPVLWLNHDVIARSLPPDRDLFRHRTTEKVTARSFRFVARSL
ncbi:hypothetical protein A2G06_11755 [Geobacter anodireducens]|nr:hypothetical protein A2G06_11755 [Geobacter anodireducens]